jgi:two-component system response regulator DesR
MTSRVVIVSPRPILREALSRWAGETGDLEVVDELTRGEEALVSAAHSRPDLVVLEADMPGMNGFETAGALSRDIPDLGIIIIAESGRPDLRKRASDVGAKGFVSKTWGRDAFRDVVRLVREGRSPVLVEVHQDTPGPPSR